MSWRIYSTGTRVAVRARVAGVAENCDTEQVKAAKAIILAEIDAMPPKTTGILVEATGHCYTSSDGEGDRSLNIKIQRTSLDL